MSGDPQYKDRGDTPRLCWLALIGLLFASLARAQDLIQNAPPPDPAAQDGAPHGGVAVDDSAVAVDKMALATRLEKMKDWTKSAEVYQDITDNYRDRVVPMGVDDQGVVDQFTSVLTLVRQHLQSWPPEGVAVYHDRYEVDAKKLLDSAQGDDLSALHQVFNKYFITDSGKQAGLRLVDAYIELGDFPSAAWISQELLGHPSLQAERPMVLFRAGLASHMSGDDATAKKALSELKDNFSTVIGTIGSRDVNIAQELADYLAKPPPSEDAASGASDSWPMIGGNVARDKVYASTARMGAELYSINLSQPNWNRISDPATRQQLAGQDATWRRDGTAVGVMPVVDRGQLFFQDDSTIYAVDLESGRPLPGWLASYPDQNGRFVMPKAWSQPNGHPFPLALTDGAIVAVMDQREPALHTYNLLPQTAKVVCLDRQTGKQNWIFSPDQLADDNLKKVTFDGSPLVVGDNVYLGGHDDKSNGYEDAYVLCLDLASGSFRWSCYVAGAASDSPEVLNTANQNLMFDVASHLSYAGGRVFVSTNLGAVAALDAYGGTVDWLHIYRDDSDVINPNMFPFMRRGFGGFGNVGPQTAFNLTRPWTVNAPIVHGGNLFVLPTDGKYILVYDCGDGRLIKKIKKADCYSSATDDTDPNAQPAEPDVLLGALDNATINDNGKQRAVDLLLLGTPSHVVAIKWREYDENNPQDVKAWVTTNLPNEMIRGRAFLTADSVYMPTTDKLYRVAIRTGEIIEEYPPEGSWPSGQGPGNVTICQDAVVVAGDQRLSVYADLSLVQRNLDQEVADNPTDPAARLRYAEVMFVANQPQLAAQKLDEAIKLLDQNGSAAVNDRAFNDALTFAMKSWHDHAGDDQINSLFDRASALAKEPSQKVSYRLYRARYAQLGRHDLAAAISLYQGILAESAMRTAAAADEQVEDPSAFPSADASTPDDSADQSQAGLVAEKAIAFLLQDSNGRNAYQPFEKAAKSQMAAAGRAGNPDAILSVADMYPNSAQAGAAKQTAADLYEAKVMYPQATRVLRDIYGDLTDDDKKVAILQRMAADYLNIPGRLDAAVGRLDAARKLDIAAQLTVPLHLPDGRVLQKMPLRQADDALDALLAAGGATDYLPDFSMPTNDQVKQYYAAHGSRPAPFLPEAAGSAIANVEALLSPSQDFARYDRVATWTQGSGVSIFPVGQNQPLGSDGDLSDEPRGAAWVDGRADLLTWTASGVALIGGDQVKTKWKLDLNSLPGVAVVAQSAPRVDVSLIVPANMRGGPGGRFRGGGGRQRLTFNPGQQQFQVTQLSSDRASDDSTAADAAAEPVINEQVADVVVTSSAAIFSTNLGRVVAVNLSDGAVLWQSRVVDHAIERLLASDDFTVIKASDDTAARLVVLDTLTGKLLGNRVITIDPSLGEGIDSYPINVALGDDGTLAYTAGEQIAIRDLYECARDPKMQRLETHTDDVSGVQRAYAGLTLPEQLLVYARQVLAVSQSGRILSVFSAETGQLREYRRGDGDSAQVLPMNLSTGSASEETLLRLGGQYVYTWGASSLAGYNLENPDVRWGPTLLKGAGGDRELFLGKDYLLVMNQPPHGDTLPSWQMSAFSRVLVSHDPAAESGLLEYTPEMTDPAGILAWQPVEGGLVYLSGDRTLHFLRGGSSGAQ